jgi:hypothetical protein
LKNRIQYAITFIVFFLTEVAIAKWGTGFVRSYVGDILVIPTIYFFLRAVIFAKDGIFSVYVLPFLTYTLGWIAEVLQAFHFVDKMGISKDSPIGIALGGVFDLRDGLCYLLGLFLIGLYLAVESHWREDRRWYYPLAVFIHWTWGHAQTMLGFCIYLWYFKSRHSYYRGVVRTVWPSAAGLSLGMFIFTPREPSPEDNSLGAQTDREYCERVAVHEYGHTIQALLLGPLYLLVIGIPSVCWAGLPKCQKIRREKHIPYTRFYCEKWASHWGEKVTKDKADWN